MEEIDKMDANSFTKNIVSVSIAVVVVSAVAIPIIGSSLLTQSSGIENYAQINDILGMLPIFLVLAILVAIVGMFITKYR